MTAALEVRGYFLDRDYMWGDPLNQGVLSYRDFASAEELRQALRRLAISYVLVGREILPLHDRKRIRAR